MLAGLEGMEVGVPGSELGARAFLAGDGGDRPAIALEALEFARRGVDGVEETLVGVVDPERNDKCPRCCPLTRRAVAVRA